MQKINWIRCSEQMPTDDYEEIILMHEGVIQRFTQEALFELVMLIDDESLFWAPFTEEAWAELNK